MKKLFKNQQKNQPAQDDDRDKDRERAISPFTVLGGPPSPEHYSQYSSQQQQQQQTTPRERRHGDRERPTGYRNSMITYSSDDISNWEVIQSHGQNEHPYRQQKQTQQDRERSASLASLHALSGSAGALPNPHPYTQQHPQQSQQHTYPHSNPYPQAFSASRTSSLNSIPPGASPSSTTPTSLVAAPGPGSGPLPNSAGSYVPSPTSPAAPALLRKKSPAAPQSQAKDTQSARPGPGTAAILRALDPSLMGGMLPSTHAQQRQPQATAPSMRSAHSRGSERDESTPTNSHPTLRVPVAKPRREKPRSARDRSRSLSLSDIEFGAGEVESDGDVDRSAEHSIDTDHDSIDLERQAREARWRERDLEIEGKTSRKGGRDSRSFFERLQLGDSDLKKERGGSREREDKDRKDKEDWKAQWASIFSTAKDKDKDKDRVKVKRDHDSADLLPTPNPRLEISNPIPLIPPQVHGPTITIPTANTDSVPHSHTYHSQPAPNALAQVQGPDVRSEMDPLTSMIGLFVSPNPNINMEGINWALALEICEWTHGRARKERKEGKDSKEAEANSKLAAKALRKELKYARPSEQLGAITLWAVMLLNASDSFITQTSSRKFLDVVEDIIRHSHDIHVRERLLEVLGAAVFHTTDHGGKDAVKRENFKTLWRRVKPEIYDDEGIMLTMSNDMFRFPFAVAQHDRDVDHLHTRPPMNDRRSSRNGIIPVDEDMRRLFQECKIGRGNAALLNEALAFATPDDLKEKGIIKEFYAKCRASQELIHAQIPWASAGAEHSRLRQLEATGGTQIPDELPSTKEEKLLAELLRANEELAEALRIYGDIERIGVESEAERKARERSKVEVRANVADLQINGEASSFLAAPSIAPSSSRSPSPSSLFMDSQSSQVSSHTPSSIITKHAVDHAPPSSLPQQFAQVHSPPVSGSDSSHSHSQSHLAPAPTRLLHGPRSPAPPGIAAKAGSIQSRSPSPVQASRPNSVVHSRGTSVDSKPDTIDTGTKRVEVTAVDKTSFSSTARVASPLEPLEFNRGTTKLSEKAAGKKRMPIDSETQDGNSEASNRDQTHNEFAPTDPLRQDSDTEDVYGDESFYPERWKVKVHYVYDAAAERTKERIREGMACRNLNNERK